MANETLLQLEDKILVALEALSYLKTRRGYQGELDVESADQLSVEWPAAFVMFESAGFTPASSDGLQFVQKPRFTVFLGDHNWRGEADRRRGGVAPGEVGTYQMIQDCLTALAGKTFGLPIGRCIPIETASVFAASGLSIYRVVFEFSDVESVFTGD